MLYPSSPPMTQRLQRRPSGSVQAPVHQPAPWQGASHFTRLELTAQSTFLTGKESFPASAPSIRRHTSQVRPISQERAGLLRGCGSGSTRALACASSAGTANQGASRQIGRPGPFLQTSQRRQNIRRNTSSNFLTCPSAHHQ